MPLKKLMTTTAMVSALALGTPGTAAASGGQQGDQGP